MQEITDSRNDSPSVALEPEYNFKRSEHKSFKDTQLNLPNIIFKRSEAKLLEYESDGEINIDSNETKISDSRNLLWAFLRMNKVEENPESQDIPGRSGLTGIVWRTVIPIASWLSATHLSITN